MTNHNYPQIKLTPYFLDDGPQYYDGKARTSGNPAYPQQEARVSQPYDPVSEYGWGYLAGAGYPADFLNHVTFVAPQAIQEIGKRAFEGSLRPTDILEIMPSNEDLARHDSTVQRAGSAAVAEAIEIIESTEQRVAEIA